MTSEPRCFLAVWIPDIECRTEHVAAGVVDEVSAKVLVAEEDFDVAGERENPRIRGDDPVTRQPAATGLTLYAILGERDWNRDAFRSARELGGHEGDDPSLHHDRFVGRRAHHSARFGH